MLSFAWPWIFLLLPLPYAVYRLAPVHNASHTALDSALKLPSYALLHAEQQQAVKPRRSTSKLILAALIWLCLLCAAARPLWLGDPMPQPRQGREIMLAVDLSASMGAEDMRVASLQRVDRLSAVKAVVGEFIQRREGDRLGLILFADAAYLQAPLTYDLKTVKQLLDESVIGLVGRSTAIGDAIGLSIKRLKDNASPDNVLILLTDGQNTAGEVEPLEAAKVAAQQDIRIYTVGLGTESLGLFSQGDQLDENTLRAIAQQTGGRYYRARNPKQLEAIYQELDQLVPRDYDAPTLRPERSLLHWPLALALLLSLLPAVSYLLNRLLLPALRHRLVSNGKQTAKREAA